MDFELNGETIMKLKIGNKIKSLRKKKGITQEQLAEKIGVSFQAVSKWENDITLPDLTLIPVLASFFGVSTDEVLCYDSSEKDKEIGRLVDESFRYRETDLEKGRAILEEGLKRFPENEILLNNLLYVMNYSKNPDEVITLASKIIDKTDCDEIKYDAFRFLAYAYKEKGDIQSALGAIEQIPELYFTKLSELAFISEGIEMYEAAEKQKWISFEILIQMMWKIAEYFIDNGDTVEAVNQTERALKLIEAMDGEEKIDNFGSYKEFLTEKSELLRNK